MEIDEDGQAIVQVTLHSRSQPNRTQTFRFILDTGAECCVFDSSIPACFFWDDSATRQLVDINGSKAVMPLVIARKVQVAGVVREGIPALRTDLKMGMMGGFQDQPVDGVLGMSFFAGTRFVLDLSLRQVEWWGQAWPGGVKVPVHYAGGKRPWVMLRVAGKEVACQVDTGLVGGLTLPWSLRPPGKGRASVTLGIAGAPATGEQLTLPEVGVGANAWRAIPVDFVAGVECGTIGLDAWSAGRTCFDFRQDQLTLSTTPETGLSYQRHPMVKLPLLWNRTGPTPALTVHHVKPESPMAAAGLMGGDEVVQVGALQGKTLSRRAIRDLVVLGQPLSWILKREGRTVHLMFPQAPVLAAPRGDPSL